MSFSGHMFGIPAVRARQNRELFMNVKKIESNRSTFSACIFSNCWHIDRC